MPRLSACETLAAAALVVRLARVSTRAAPGCFAQACVVSDSRLGRIEYGHTRSSVGELTEMLTASGEGLRVRIDVHEDQDDEVHLSTQADPELHGQGPANPTQQGTSERS